MSECRTSSSESMIYFLKNIYKENLFNVVLIRDFSYLDLIKKREVFKMKDYLKQLRKTIKWVKENPNYSKETLILLTGAEPVGMEFPKKGKEWIQYERGTKFIL